MTLLVVANGLVLSDSFQSLGSISRSVDKRITRSSSQYAVAGDVDVGNTIIDESLVDGEFSPKSAVRGHGTWTSVIVKTKEDKIYCLDDAPVGESATWRGLSNDADVQYVTGAGGEQFLGFYAFGMSVDSAFEAVAKVNNYVELPIRSF